MPLWGCPALANLVQRHAYDADGLARQGFSQDVSPGYLLQALGYRQGLPWHKARGIDNCIPWPGGETGKIIAPGAITAQHDDIRGIGSGQSAVECRDFPSHVARGTHDCVTNEPRTSKYKQAHPERPGSRTRELAPARHR